MATDIQTSSSTNTTIIPHSPTASDTSSNTRLSSRPRTATMPTLSATSSFSSINTTTRDQQRQYPGSIKSGITISRTVTISKTSNLSSSITNHSIPPSLQSTSNSISTIADSIAPEQRPRFIQPALKTPTWPNTQGILSVICSTSIPAPIHLILAIVLDSRTWPSWNTFCPRVTITNQPKSTAPLPPCIARVPSVNAIANLSTTLRDGTSFTFEVCMDPENAPKKKASPTLQVTHLEQFERDGRVGVRLVWCIRGKIASFLTRSERVQEFLPAEGNANVTEYTCWETYYGVLATTMRNMYGKQLEDGYGRWMDGLKEYSGERWEAESRILS